MLLETGHSETSSYINCTFWIALWNGPLCLWGK